MPGEVINKVPVVMEMSAGLYGYLLGHTREHPVNGAAPGHAMCRAVPPVTRLNHSVHTCHLAHTSGTASICNQAPGNESLNAWLQALRALREETSSMRGAHMQVGRMGARLHAHHSRACATRGP